MLIIIIMLLHTGYKFSSLSSHLKNEFQIQNN
jgi:hypothetical protein